MVTERELDEVLIRIGEDIDRYRASRPPVRVADVESQDRGVNDGRRLRRGALVAVAASVLAAAGVWGVASYNRSEGDGALGEPSVPRELVVPEPGVLTPVVEPLLPDGFVVVRETAVVPFVVTALGPYGVRLDVRVGLDEADIVRQQVGDTMVSAPAGEMTSNGSMVFTTAGDVISVDALYGDRPADGGDLSVSFAAVAPSDIAGIAAGVAGAIDGAVRGELVARASNVGDLATASLFTEVQEAFVTATGGTLSVSGGADPGHFQVGVVSPAATSLTLTAIYSSQSIDDGIIRPSEGTVTATAVVNDWIVQLVDIDSTAPPGALADADIEAIFDAIEPIFGAWTNELSAGTACDSYTVRTGDSLASIAEMHRVTLDALSGANAGRESALLPGVVINIPCLDGSAGTPANDLANDPVMEPSVTTTAPDEGVPYVVIDPPPAGYTFSSAISARNGKDYEPPALLLAWTSGDGDHVPITVGRVDPATPATPPTGAQLVATDAVSGWIWTTDGITSANLQPTDGPGYRLYSSADEIPGDVLVEIVNGLTPDGTLMWQSDLPEGVVELARQDRDATLHAATYEGVGGAVTVAAYNDLPVNGLTLNPGATVTPDLSILGMSGFVMTNPSIEGATERVLYWSSDDGPVFSISSTDADATVDDLITIAEQTRPASPEEEAEFEQQ